MKYPRNDLFSQAARKAGLSVTYAAGHSLDVSSTDTSMIPAAVAAAKAADVAVVMVGLCADNCVGRGRTENEGNDRGPVMHTIAQHSLLWRALPQRDMLCFPCHFLHTIAQHSLRDML